MESTSSSTTNKLQNSYFLYGTHPLKVPTALVHASSTTNLSSSILTPEQSSVHLSLNLNNSSHHSFSSTNLLHNLPKSRTDDDENNEVKKKKKRYLFITFYHMYMSLTILYHCLYKHQHMMLSHFHMYLMN